MNIKAIKIRGYEEVWKCVEPKSGLHAFIAVHNTKLGPGLGGIRMHNYPDEQSALDDVLRLSKAMTYKAAGAGLDLGGGKAVILGDPAKSKKHDLLSAMGDFIETLEGRYLAAKDAGIITEDLTIIAKQTSYVTGLPQSTGGSGDPSPWTAVGMMEGLRACIESQFPDSDIAQLSFCIQGLGHVGSDFAMRLWDRGAHLKVCDKDPSRLKPFETKDRIEIIDVSSWHKAKADILSPCALGGVINQKTIPELQCNIIAGGANNQIDREIEDAELLNDMNILFTPDYILNAGGLINIYVRDILKKEDPYPWFKKIYQNLKEIFERSRKEGINSLFAANQLVQERLH